MRANLPSLTNLWQLYQCTGMHTASGLLLLLLLLASSAVQASHLTQTLACDGLSGSACGVYLDDAAAGGSLTAIPFASGTLVVGFWFRLSPQKKQRLGIVCAKPFWSCTCLCTMCTCLIFWAAYLSPCRPIHSEPGWSRSSLEGSIARQGPTQHSPHRSVSRLNMAADMETTYHRRRSAPQGCNCKLKQRAPVLQPANDAAQRSKPGLPRPERPACNRQQRAGGARHAAAGCGPR